MSNIQFFPISLTVLVLLVTGCIATPSTVKHVAATNTPAPTSLPTSPPVPTLPKEPEVIAHANVPYVEGGDRKQKLDIYLPPLTCATHGFSCLCSQRDDGHLYTLCQDIK